MLSVPAQSPSFTPPDRPTRPGVTTAIEHRDPATLLAAAASNPAVSDRAMRVYTVLVTTFDRGATADQVAAFLPAIEEGQASRLLGALVREGLLEKRLRTIGYREGALRIRRSFYTLAGGAL